MRQPHVIAIENRAALSRNARREHQNDINMIWAPFRVNISFQPS
jgi:hypothetical protein